MVLMRQHHFNFVSGSRLDSVDAVTIGAPTKLTECIDNVDIHDKPTGRIRSATADFIN